MAGIWSRFFGNAASTAAGYGIGTALGPALAPATRRAANDLWTAHPFMPLSPSQAAQAVARGFLAFDAGNDESHNSGVDDRRFGLLKQLAEQPPTVEELLALRNREAISETELDAGLAQQGLRTEWRTPLKALRNVLVPVSDLVRMAVREVFDPGQRAALTLDAEFPAAMLDYSRALGLSDQAARDYWAAHWQLPSPEQAFEMFHRGDLDPGQLDGLLKALDYAPTWRAKLRKLAERIPPISDMIRFAVREVYDPAQRASLGLDADYPDQFTAEARLHGMSEERAKQYWAAHWRLPSAEQGFKMLHRNVIDEPQLLGLLKALDYPAVWRERLNEIAYLVPGRIDLRRMYALGVIDRAGVKRGYQRLGYTTIDAETLTEFTVRLAAGGSTDYADKARTQLWTTTHRSFLAGETDEDTATQRLAAIGVPAAQQADVIELWTMERTLTRRQLTPAQIKKAYLKGTINPATNAPWTRDEAIGAMVELGYASPDAVVFLDTV